MLTRSFIFLDGVGPETERRLWELGIATWQGYHERIRELPFHPRRKYRWQKQLWDAEDALNRRDARYFERWLPHGELWRMLADFWDETAFLDVEAYQKKPGRYVLTLVGMLYRGVYQAFVRGRNLRDVKGRLRRARFLVTFGGQNFDLRMLTATFGLEDRRFAACDFQPIYKVLGLPQGLKKLEKMFGWRRGSGLDGLGGWLAVQLWEMHREGDDRAIRALIRYNYEDVIHLPFLAVYAYNRMIEQFRYPFHPLPLPEITPRAPRFDRSVLYDVKRRFYRRRRS